jgi:outer membrane receptor protein involved in Fe transport
MAFLGLLPPLLGVGPAAADGTAGEVRGTVFGSDTAGPVAGATVILEREPGDVPLRSAVADSKGAFAMEGVPFGAYKAVVSAAGYEGGGRSAIALDAGHPLADLGRLSLVATAVKLGKFEVTEHADAFYDSIDRRVYNVGKDIMSATGSVSDALQKIPSVHVDIDGNVSLRGDSSVQILVDGKTSVLMAGDRAAALEQMPADEIERIEVITNPSAKYSPEGTGGIINLVLKHNVGPGTFGSVNASAGNYGRYNLGASGHRGAGKFNLFGSVNLRQDDKQRFRQDVRSHLDAASGTFVGSRFETVDRSRPLGLSTHAGVEYKPDAGDKLSASAAYEYHSLTRKSREDTVVTDDSGAVTSDYSRVRTEPEFQRQMEAKASYEHLFPEKGRELNVSVKSGWSHSQESDQYEDLFAVPMAAPSFDLTRPRTAVWTSESSVQYVLPFRNSAKLDTGYTLYDGKIDNDDYGASYDPASSAWVADPLVTNRFIDQYAIQSVYATYGRPVGSFGFLAGLRAEQNIIDTDQVTAVLKNRNEYYRLYPSLHLSYYLTANAQLQLSYSHRIHRPDSGSLNPYPQYSDPYNLYEGNPNLKPEDSHSIEGGYQYRRNGTNFQATLFYRRRYHGITSVTRYISATTLLTTLQNLSSSQSGGLELAAAASFGPRVSLNVSGDLYRYGIDASNLGYATSSYTDSWSGKASSDIRLSKSTVVQISGELNGRRLTPQGYTSPTGVLNLGIRHELIPKKFAVVLTVADLFDSLRDRTVIDTPQLHDDVTRWRASRFVTLGFVCYLGKSTRKTDADPLEFDNDI